VALSHNGEFAVRIDPSGQEGVNVVSHSQHPVGVVAGQVILNQGLGDPLSIISGHPRPDKDLAHNRAQTFSGDVDYRSLQDKDEGNSSTIGAFLQAGGLLTPCCPSGYDSARGSACP